MRWDFESRIELQDGGSWVDISADVNTGTAIEVERGIQGSGVKDRTARPGLLRFELLNVHGGITGRYDPHSPNVRSGWGLQAAQRLVFRFEGIEVIKWQGRISSLTVSREIGEPFVRVEAEDYLALLRRPMRLPALATHKTSYQTALLVLGYSADLPEGTENHNSLASWPTVFDTVRKETAALTELSALALAELGYIFVKGSRTCGEVFTVQGLTGRWARDYPLVPLEKENACCLTSEDNDCMITEAGETLLADDVQGLFSEALPDYDLPPNQMEVGVIVNRCQVQYYPRREDSSSRVLFSLDAVEEIGPGKSLVMRGEYSDPDQKAQKVNSYSMRTPLPMTDFLANAASDGSGADLTGSLNVSAAYSVNEVTFTLENSGAQTLFVTLLQARGFGIYTYQPVTVEASDQTSIDTYGEQLLSLSLRYLDRANPAWQMASDLVEKLKEPLTGHERVGFQAGVSAPNLLAMMFCEPGDPLQVVGLRWYLNGYRLRAHHGRWQVSWVLASQAVSEPFDTYSI